MSEDFELPHRVSTLHQVEQCTTAGTPQAPHSRHLRQTGKSNYVCNCGYSSGWVDSDLLPLPSDFFAAHTEETVRYE